MKPSIAVSNGVRWNSNRRAIISATSLRFAAVLSPGLHSEAPTLEGPSTQNVLETITGFAPLGISWSKVRKAVDYFFAPKPKASNG